MKQIIHITTFLQGGAGRIICDLACNQARQGFTVYCLCNNIPYPGYTNYPEYESKLDETGIKLKKINGLFKREISGIKAASDIIAMQIQEAGFPYVVHCHSSVPSLAAMLARNTIGHSFPIVQTMHGWGMNKSEKQELMDIEILSQIDQVVSVSESSRTLLLEKGVPESRVLTIYNGISENRLRDAEIESFTLSSKHQHLLNSLPSGSFSIVCVGTVCDRKNQSLLLDSIAKLISLNISVRCYFIGDDDNEYAQALKSKALRIGLSDNVKFWGCLEHADQCLSAFDVLVLPSRAEGLPLSIIEAFREKILVAASNISECRELLQDGVSGFLFELDSVSSLTSTLLKVLGMDLHAKEKITEYSYLQYELYFKNSVMFKNYSDLYLRLPKKPVIK